MSHQSNQARFSCRTALPSLCVLAAFALGCGDFSGGTPPTVNGPAAATQVAPPDPTVATAAFQTTVYPILTQNCGTTCHVGGGTEGTPLIAHPDIATAYSAVVDTQKVNFSTPASSRLVRRLVRDQHNCWFNCMMDAAEMEAAIVAWAAAIQDAGGGGTVVTGGLFSTALSLAQGSEDQGDRRYNGNLVALYEFKEGAGTVARDTSGTEPAMDLSLQGPTFMSGYGIDVQDGRAIAEVETSRKIYDRIARPNVGTQQYSIEAWVTPDNTDQEGPARIVNYSRGTGNRNFGLGQVGYQYDFRNRSSAPEINDNGDPSLRTYDMDEDLQATLQHVVITYDQFRGRRIWVNGRFTDDEDPVEASRLWNWDEEYRLVLGNETSNDRQWLGNIRLVAIYDHVLTEAQIRQNFDAGVGKRLLLSFDVSQWVGPGGFLDFSVREFDEHSYLFCSPTLRSNATGFRVSNLRIMVNGVIPVQGQAFVNVDTLVNGTSQELSGNCSIIAKDLGADQDVFAVAFEALGDFEDPVVADPPGTPVPPVFGAALPGTGIRDFARVNATMAQVTGVDPNNPAVRATFDELEQQLPPGTDLRAFSSSQQVGIAKLSLEYCDRMVENPALRTAAFPGFDFNEAATTAFDSAARTMISQQLADRFYGSALLSQPDALTEVFPVVDGLITELTAVCSTDPGQCNAVRTRTILKASCAAVLGSAGATLH